MTNAIDREVGNLELAAQLQDEIVAKGASLDPKQTDEVVRRLRTALKVFVDGEILECLPYRGFDIRPTPHQLAESGEWQINVLISRDDGSSVVRKPFSAANSFGSREEAIFHCFVFGKRIIDGEVNGCTVDDL